MKISKLFHWLYAVLMFLPIFMFLPTGLYYAFNDNAQNVNYIPTPKYQTNEVNSVNDLVVGNVYHCDELNLGASYFDTDIWLYIVKVDNYSVSQMSYVDEINYAPYNAKIGNDISINYWGDGSDITIVSYLTNENAYVCTYYENPNDFVLFDFDFYCDDLEQLQTLYTWWSLDLTPSNYQEYEYTQIDNITDNMVYAWDKTWHSDLFSWANDSFLTVPFRYLTDLFSIPSSSTIIYAFSYWLTISIVWLCFDVLIYVPQLAHRWLDKASLE